MIYFSREIRRIRQRNLEKEKGSHGSLWLKDEYPDDMFWVKLRFTYSQSVTRCHTLVQSQPRVSAQYKRTRQRREVHTVVSSCAGCWIWLYCSLREHSVTVSLHSDSGVRLQTP